MLNFFTCYHSSEVPSYKLTCTQNQSSPLFLIFDAMLLNWLLHADTMWKWAVFFTVLGKPSHFSFERPQIRIAAWRPAIQTEEVISLEKFWNNILNRMWPLSSTWILEIFCQSTIQNPCNVIIHSKNHTKFRILTMSEYAKRLLVNKQLPTSKFYQHTQTCKSINRIRIK